MYSKQIFIKMNKYKFLNLIKKKERKKRKNIAFYKFVGNHQEEKHIWWLWTIASHKKGTKILQPGEISSYYLSSCNLASGRTFRLHIYLHYHLSESVYQNGRRDFLLDYKIIRIYHI